MKKKGRIREKKKRKKDQLALGEVVERFSGEKARSSA